MKNFQLEFLRITEDFADQISSTNDDKGTESDIA